MDFLISFMVALIIMALGGVVSQSWYKFSRRGQKQEGWRESETQRMVREVLEKKQWEVSRREIIEEGANVSSAVAKMHHKISH